jgi:hypothetical protein
MTRLSHTSFAQAFEVYLDFAKANRSEKTWKCQEKLLHEVVLPVFKDWKMIEFLQGTYMNTLEDSPEDAHQAFSSSTPSFRIR